MSDKEWDVSADNAARKRDNFCELMSMLFRHDPRIVTELPKDYDESCHGQVQIIRREQILYVLAKHWNVQQAFKFIVAAEDLRGLPQKDSPLDLITMKWPDKPYMMDVTDAELKSAQKSKINYEHSAVIEQKMALWELGYFSSDDSDAEVKAESKKEWRKDSKEDSEEDSDVSHDSYKTPQRTQKKKIPPAPSKPPPNGKGKEASDKLNIEESATPLSWKRKRPRSPSPEPMSSREAELLAANEKLQKQLDELQKQICGDDGGGRSVAVPRRAAARQRRAQVAVRGAPARNVHWRREVTPQPGLVFVSPRRASGLVRTLSESDGVMKRRSTRVPGGQAKKPRK
jgi:hypothetical protein